jgi:hypothetical protein
MVFCTRCEKEKEDVFFGKNQRWCKICHSEYKKLWERENRDRVKATKRRYDIVNRDRQRNYIRQYRSLNKDSVAKNRKLYVTNRRIVDPAYRLNQLLASSINKALKKTNSSKNGQSKSKYLPYSMQELKIHIENQFESWMTWNNQGVYNHKTWDDNDSSTWTWNIDHITPRADLPYASMTDDNFQKCWSLNNLRPLSSKTNIIEGARKTRHRR